MIERPWTKRAIELEPTQHHWADYAAWKEWFQDQETNQLLSADSDILGTLGPIEDTPLYLMFCKAYDAVGTALSERDAAREALKPLAAMQEPVNLGDDELVLGACCAGDIRRARATLSAEGANEQ